MIEKYSVHHNKDDSFYIISEDTGEQFSFESAYHILEYSTNDTREQQGNEALFYVDVNNVEFFDEEGMMVGMINENSKRYNWIIRVMEDYFREDANEEFKDSFNET